MTDDLLDRVMHLTRKIEVAGRLEQYREHLVLDEHGIGSYRWTLTETIEQVVGALVRTALDDTTELTGLRCRVAFATARPRDPDGSLPAMTLPGLPPAESADSSGREETPTAARPLAPTACGSRQPRPARCTPRVPKPPEALARTTILTRGNPRKSPRRSSPSPLPAPATSPAPSSPSTAGEPLSDQALPSHDTHPHNLDRAASRMADAGRAAQWRAPPGATTRLGSAAVWGLVPSPGRGGRGRSRRRVPRPGLGRGRPAQESPAARSPTPGRTRNRPASLTTPSSSAPEGGVDACRIRTAHVVFCRTFAVRLGEEVRP